MNSIDTLTEQYLTFADNYRPTYLEAATYNLSPCVGVEGGYCHEPATVHHLASKEKFCLRHFRYFERHFGESFETYVFGRKA